MWLKGTPKHLVGLDIGACAVKLLLLARRGCALCVEFYGIAPLPPGAVQAGHISDVAAVGEAIRSLVAQSPKRPRRAASALPGVLATIKTLQLDASLSDEEVDAQVTVDAAQHLPCPIEEAAYDFEVQGLSESTPGEAEVLLAACRADEVQGYQAALAAGGVRPTALEIQAFAQARALARIWPQLVQAPRTQGPIPVDAALALLDLGATNRLLLLEPSRCLWEKELPAARGAESAQAGLTQNHRTLAGQVAEALDACRVSSHLRRAGALYLAGGGARTQGLVNAMERAVSLPVAVLDPFVGMSLSPSLARAALQGDAPALLTACGLALRGDA